MARRQGGRWRVVLPILAAVLAAPLARPVLMRLLDAGRLEVAVDAISVRAAMLVAAAMSLHTYSDLVRSPDRAVLDAHPVQPRSLVRAIAGRTARQRLYLPIMAAVLMVPVAQVGGVAPWLGCVGVVVGAWLGSLGVGFAVHLGAVWAARSPGLARALDALRGDNPRTQAALIYAPGFALFVLGIACAFASAGLSYAVAGNPVGWAFLLIPPGLGLLSWLAVPALADRYYVRATALLTEIDGLVAGADAGGSSAEDRAVYLEWLARDRPELLRQLRQGWRAHRTWGVGAWGLGLLGLLAAWSTDPGVEGRLLSVVGGCLVLYALLPARLAQGDPPWLDEALGVSPRAVDGARLGVAWLYGQGVVLPALAAGLLRHGHAVWVPVLVVELVGLLTIGTGVLFARRMRGQGAWFMGPIALVAWALLSAAGGPELSALWSNLLPFFGAADG